MALIYKSELQDFQEGSATNGNWNASTHARHISNSDTGFVTATAASTITDLNGFFTDIFPSVIGTTIRFTNGTPADTDLITITYQSRTENFSIYFYQKRQTGVGYTGNIFYNNSIGDFFPIADTYTYDTINGDTFRFVIDSDGICKVYANGIYLNKFSCLMYSGGSSPLILTSYSTYSEVLSFAFYDQEIYPPEDLPSVSVSNGTLYFTSDEVRNAGRFRNKEILPVASGDTTYMHSTNIDNVKSLLRVTKSTGAKAYLTQVESSPATGQYIFTKPNIFVFGDTSSNDYVFYADVERMVYDNEISDVREEVQAEIDAVLSSKFTTVPLPTNRIFQQVRTKGAEMAALKIMMRHQDMMGKNMPGLQERYNYIVDELKSAEVFTLDGTIYKTDNPRSIKIGYWQDGHFAAKENRKSLWGT